MDIRTHGQIDRELCGTPTEVAENHAKVEMTAAKRMAVDETGLVHGGFLFGLADHAAMLAVNHPNVVLGGAEVRFLKPVLPGDRLVAEAAVTEIAGKKHAVEAFVYKNDETVFSGRFDCFVLDRHVLA